MTPKVTYDVKPQAEGSWAAAIAAVLVLTNAVCHALGVSVELTAAIAGVVAVGFRPVVGLLLPGDKNA